MRERREMKDQRITIRKRKREVKEPEETGERPKCVYLENVTKRFCLKIVGRPGRGSSFMRPDGISPSFVSRLVFSTTRRFL